MSMYSGVRSHASEATAADQSRSTAGRGSRLAAVGVAVLLSVGFSGAAHAAGDGRPSDTGIENGDLVAVCHEGHTIWVSEPALSAHLDHGDEQGPCGSETGSQAGGSDEGGSQEGGSDEGGSQEGGSDEGGSQEGGSDEGGSQEGGSDEGAGGETVATPTPTPTPEKAEDPAKADREGAEKGGAEKSAAKKSGTVKDKDKDEVKDKDTRAKDETSVKAKDSDEVLGDAGERPEVGDEADDTDADVIRGVDEVPAANRTAAVVLPQTGARDHLALQAGAGLGLLAAGAAMLLGRRRVSHT
jgi:LPXTG-motif cell wall-anchored protein